MSSTTPPSGPPPLSARERLVLESMVHHECRHDPEFVHRLTTWSPADPGAGSPRRPAAGAVVAVVGALVVLGVLVGLALAGLVALAAAGVVLMLVAPLTLVLWARRRASP
jgi:hypothetical protein